MASMVDSGTTDRLKDRLVNKVMRRVREKRGPMTPPFQLEYRHVFVLPTRFGWGFGFMLILMALGGLNFNNNMALLLVFLLGTITQLTTFIAYRNLSGLEIGSVVAEPVFAGETAHFKVFISNGDEHRRFAIQLGFKKPQACIDFALNSNDVVVLKHITTQRGWMEMPLFRLETRFPLGCFKAWSWVFPKTRCLVYATPALNPPRLPKTGQGQFGQASKGEGEQVYGLRKYQPGDSIQRVAWRASARHDELYSLEMEAPKESACELNWHQLKGKGVEARLSILTAWVIAADHKQLAYSLELPGEKVAAGSGPEHRSKCLELLALFSA